MFILAYSFRHFLSKAGWLRYFRPESRQNILASGSCDRGGYSPQWCLWKRGGEVVREGEKEENTHVMGYSLQKPVTLYDLFS